MLVPLCVMGLLIIIFAWEEIEQRFHQEQISILGSIKKQVVDRHADAMENTLLVLSQDDELWQIHDDPQVQNRILKNWRLLQQIFPKRAWIYYGDTRNRIIVSPPWEPPENYDLRERPWYTAAKESGELTWIQPYAEFITNETVFTAAVPIHNKQGDFAGVLAIDTFLQDFFHGMRTEALKETSQLLIVTRNNETISLTPEQAGGVTPDSSFQWSNFFRNTDSSGYINLNGTSYYAAFKELTPLQFYLVSLTPRSAIMSEMETLGYIIILVTLIGILVTGAGSIYIARYVLSNIKSLNSYMHDISQGDLTIRTCVSGEDEFLTLNSYMNTMVRTLSRQIESQRSTNQELAEKNKKLDRLANVDGLTRIANQRYFTETIQREWERLGREKQPLSLLFLDIDFFKPYNDHYGHQAGDDCLRIMGGILENVTRRPADIAARYGGEEFVVLLPNTPSEGARQIALEIQNNLAQKEIPHEKSEASPYLTCSIGVATTVPGNEFSADSLVDEADKAMYEAKKQGRNRIVVSS
ncbi:MAG: diguanylate cyclase [Spirochaetaceae bacterium]|nr:diguanylate cyclase [Spirochaetaceae bacterium]MCF7950822.1 diguanylate cyclase [Spirochaetaceae bacterium]